MAKTRTVFFCTDCGNETARWQGQCPACAAWNTLVAEPASPRRGTRESAAAATASVPPVPIRDVGTADTARWCTGIDELDFVLGGGVVPGSVVLVGGEPGVGKSTLLLQAAARLHGTGRTALYVSGEESAAQVRLRADRLAEPAGDVLFLAEISLEAILARAAETAPSIVFIDSVQTVATDAVEGAPGNVGQVRECAARLQRFAKDSGAAVFLIGHVTKGGVVAGPRTLEHIVDTVLYFEAAEGLQHRVLRAVKNRFGGVDEIGVFRMTPSGLLAVSNPSELFLGERRSAVSGTAVAAVIEGTRPLLVEVQALCTRASYGAAQRVSTGYDRQRMTLLLAVLEKRAALPFAELDAFLNVVGGLRIVEPAGDLAVAAALASSALDRPLPADAAFIGELGLGGEIRAVSQIERRIAEAARLGFATVYAPAHALPGRPSQDLNVVGVSDIGQLLRQALG
jgi:DNA repair protein RadA/Sms